MHSNTFIHFINLKDFLQIHLMTKKVVSLPLIFLFLTVLLIKTSSFQIKHGKILDDQNRQIYFHGVNIAVKVPPYLPQTDKHDQNMSFAQSDIDKLKENGFNAIRLGIMWAGVQPKQNQYNETYLKECVKIVNTAGDAGIYTLIEFHQYALSQSFCGFGVPPWLIKNIDRYKSFPFPVQKDAYPIDDQCWIPDKLHCKRHNTSAYHYSYDTAQGFEELYQQDSQLNKKVKKFWQKVAQYFKQNKYVIAYEFMNSPWVGNQFKNPALLIPGVADKIKLQPFYDTLSQSIRQIDTKTPLCFQPSKIDSSAPSGFSHPPGGNNYRDQSILCYHYQCSDKEAIRTRVSDARRMKIPSLISKTRGGKHALHKAQQYYQSWFYHCYKKYGEENSNYDSQLYQKYQRYQGYQRYQKCQGQQEFDQSLYDKLSQKDICPSLIRTYFQRVAGCLTYSSFNEQNGRFIGSFTADPDGQSILYLNKQKIYNNKYSIQASPKDLVDIIENDQQVSRNYVIIKFKGKQRQQVMVNVIKLSSQQDTVARQDIAVTVKQDIEEKQDIEGKQDTVAKQDTVVQKQVSQDITGQTDTPSQKVSTRQIIEVILQQRESQLLIKQDQQHNR